MAIALAYAAGTQLAFASTALAVGGLYPLGAIAFCTLGGVVYRSVVEEREKRRIRHAFRHYVNPEVADMLAKHPERLRLGGERREISVLFSDIRGFTGISETVPPEKLGELLNEHMDAMTEVIFSHQVLLDKYVGDAVMALWGAPVHAPHHALACCRAALEMLARVQMLQAHWRERGLPLIEIGVGIATGEAVVGNFGSARRFNYTALGDTVNLASRLEALNKQHGTRILIAESTRQAIGGAFLCREIDVLPIRGRVQPVTVYELLGRPEDLDGRLARRVAAMGRERRTTHP